MLIKKDENKQTDSENEDFDPNSLLEGLIEEFQRVGFSEIHTVAAITGASCAQEIIKIITKQYVPIPGIWIYDGVKGKSASYSSLETGF